MKNFLAIDTSNDYLLALAVKDGQAFSSFVPDCAMRHSLRLMTETDALLAKANAKPSDFDCFCAVVGPGSFTGIRIGVASVKAFALAEKKPTIAVTAFDVVAYNEIGKKQLCLVDAMHGFYYAQKYQNGKAEGGACYLSEAEVFEIVANGYTPTSVQNLPLFERVAGQVVSAEQGLQNAVVAKMNNGEFSGLDALYVRKSSAEINACKR